MHCLVEYFGIQHYQDHPFFGNYSNYQAKDKEKQEICKQHNITLIIVPYTWNSSLLSIASTIRKIRPDIPLALSPDQESKIATVNSIEDPSTIIGSIASTLVRENVPLSPQNVPNILMHPSVYSQHCDYTGWYASEKVDGVRAVWTGSQLVSRNGQVIHQFMRHLDTLKSVSLKLDCELHYNDILQNSDHDAIHFINSKDEKVWERVHLVIFDVIDLKLNFTDRLQLLESLQQTLLSASETSNQHKEEHPISILKHILITSPTHLQQVYESVISKGGEGLVLRAPNSMYTSGRSSFVCKRKNFNDTEVRLIGKHKTRVKLTCEQYVNVKVADIVVTAVFIIV